MDTDKSVLSHIKEVLKANPRGLNVTDVADKIMMNRQSVAKYLEMLVMSGHVDVRTLGPSKVYYLSQRLPISAMLDLTYSFIIVLDQNLSIINVNDIFLDFAGLKREDLLYKNFEKFAFPIEFEPSILPNVKGALRGEESSIESLYRKKGDEAYYNVRFIPMVMEAGEKGVCIFMEDITERKNIENAVRQSEFKFRSIIRETLNGILLTDEQGIVIEFNPSGEKILDVRRDEVIGKALWDTPLLIIHTNNNGEMQSNWKHLIQSYLKSGKSMVDRSTMEQNILCPDGVNKTLQIVIFSIKSEKGHMLCCVYTDITDSKRAVVELKRSEEKFRALVDSTDAGFLITNGSNVIEANNAAARITGYSKDELVGMNIVKIISPEVNTDELIRLVSDDVLAIKNGEHRQKNAYEGVIIAKGGERRNIVFTVGMIDYQREDLGIVTFYDISERKRMEEMLLLTQLSVDKSLGPVIWHTYDGKITYANEAACQSLGYTKEELMAIMISDIDPEYSPDLVKSTWIDKLRKKGHCTVEVTHRSKNGRIFPVEVHTNLLQFGDQEFFVATCRDISDRKKRDEDIRRSKEDLDNQIEARTMELEIADKALTKEIDDLLGLNEDLADSQRTLTTLISNLPGMAYRGKNDNYRTMDFVSDGFRQITGYEPVDVVANKKVSYDEIVHPDDRKRVRDEVKSALKRNVPFSITYRITTATGDIRWVYEQGRGVFSPYGDFIDIEGYVMDISDLRDTRSAQKKSEEKYAALVESISDGVWEMDKDLKICYVSKHLKNVLGIKSQDMIGRMPSEFLVPEDVDRMRGIIHSMVKRKSKFAFVKCSLLDKNGVIVPVEVSGNPILDENDEFQGFLCIIRILK
jgi:PAS domain S-box-containing protein